MSLNQRYEAALGRNVFRDNFWGENDSEQPGIVSVLHKLKQSQYNCEELLSFAQYRVEAEESYIKHLAKMRIDSANANAAPGKFQFASTSFGNLLSSSNKFEENGNSQVGRVLERLRGSAGQIEKSHSILVTVLKAEVVQPLTEQVQKMKKLHKRLESDFEKANKNLEKEHSATLKAAKDYWTKTHDNQGISSGLFAAQGGKKNSEISKAKGEYQSAITRLDKAYDAWEERIVQVADTVQETDIEWMCLAKQVLEKFLNAQQTTLGEYVNRSLLEIFHIWENIDPITECENFIMNNSTGTDRPKRTTFQAPQSVPSYDMMVRKLQCTAPRRNWSRRLSRSIHSVSASRRSSKTSLYDGSSSTLPFDATDAPPMPIDNLHARTDASTPTLAYDEGQYGNRSKMNSMYQQVISGGSANGYDIVMEQQQVYIPSTGKMPNYNQFAQRDQSEPMAIYHSQFPNTALEVDPENIELQGVYPGAAMLAQGNFDTTIYNPNAHKRLTNPSEDAQLGNLRQNMLASRVKSSVSSTAVSSQGTRAASMIIPNYGNPVRQEQHIGYGGGNYQQFLSQAQLQNGNPPNDEYNRLGTFSASTIVMESTVGSRNSVVTIQPPVNLNQVHIGDSVTELSPGRKHTEKYALETVDGSEEYLKRNGSTSTSRNMHSLSRLERAATISYHNDESKNASRTSTLRAEPIVEHRRANETSLTYNLNDNSKPTLQVDTSREDRAHPRLHSSQNDSLHTPESIGHPLDRTRQLSQNKRDKSVVDRSIITPNSIGTTTPETHTDKIVDLSSSLLLDTLLKDNFELTLNFDKSLELTQQAEKKYAPEEVSPSLINVSVHMADDSAVGNEVFSASGIKDIKQLVFSLPKLVPRPSSRPTIIMESYIEVTDEAATSSSPDRPWSRFWCTIEESQIWLYNDPMDNKKSLRAGSKPQGVLPLTRDTKISAGPLAECRKWFVSDRQYLFTIMSPSKKPVVFDVGSRELLLYWLNALVNSPRYGE